MDGPTWIVCIQTLSTIMDLVQKTLAALLLGALIAVLVFLVQEKKTGIRARASKFHKPTFLMVGARGAGKTSLYQRLLHLDQKPLPTISSLEPNVGTIHIPFSNPAIGKKFQLMDYPGHLKYSQLLRKLITDEITIKNLKGVVVVIDSSTQSITKDGKLESIARALFDLLSLTERTPNGVDYLFAINKQDLFDSKPVQRVKQQLAEELDRLILDQLATKTSGHGGSGIDNDDDEDDVEGTGGEANYLKETAREFWLAVKRPNEAFQFEMMEGNMEFIGGSVTKNKIDNWENWFDEKAVNYGGM